jgi:hypothetical protein
MNQTHCKHLRTKKIYINAMPEEALADKEGEHVIPCHFWCNRTQTPSSGGRPSRAQGRVQSVVFVLRGVNLHHPPIAVIGRPGV